MDMVVFPFLEDSRLCSGDSSCRYRGFRVPLRLLARHRRDSFFDRSRVVHRAELGAAHSAELGALKIFRGKCLVVVFTRALGVERKSELLVPVEVVSRARKRV